MLNPGAGLLCTDTVNAPMGRPDWYPLYKSIRAILAASKRRHPFLAALAVLMNESPNPVTTVARSPFISFMRAQLVERQPRLLANGSLWRRYAPTGPPAALTSAGEKMAVGHQVYDIGGKSKPEKNSCPPARFEETYFRK